MRQDIVLQNITRQPYNSVTMPPTPGMVAKVSPCGANLNHSQRPGASHHRRARRSFVHCLTFTATKHLTGRPKQAATHNRFAASHAPDAKRLAGFWHYRATLQRGICRTREERTGADHDISKTPIPPPAKPPRSRARLSEPSCQPL